MVSIDIQARTPHAFQGQLMKIPKNLSQNHGRNVNLSQIELKEILLAKDKASNVSTQRNGGETLFYRIFGLQMASNELF